MTIRECSREPAYLDLDYHLESLSDGYPFYIAAHERDANGNRMVLTVNPVD